MVASVGSGVTNRRQVTDSCGTAEALIRPLAADPGVDPAAGIPDGISTGWHVLPGHYCLLSGLRLGIDFIPLLDRLGAPAAHGRTALDEPVLAALGDGGPGCAAAWTCQRPPASGTPRWRPACTGRRTAWTGWSGSAGRSRRCGSAAAGRPTRCCAS